MSKRRFFNTIKRRVLSQLPKRVSVKKVSWSCGAGSGSARPDSFWAKQLKGIETLGQGLVVMRTS